MNETDFETMIAEARDVLGRVNADAVYHDSLFQYRGGVLVRELTLIVRDLADALESVCAERDAALARIAELEAELEVAMRPHSECERSGAEVGERIVDLEGDLAKAKARIAEAAKLHRKYTYYELEDSCPDTTDEHREEHHYESDEIGEFYCDQMPTGDVCCGTCRDVNGDRMDWPCDTIQALDGAPEPEGRWEYRGRLQSCGYVAEGYISAEHAMNGLRVELEDHPYLAMDDTAIVDRARVREWLPVEGESKP